MRIAEISLLISSMKVITKSTGLLLPHPFEVRVRDEERDRVARARLPPHDDELLGPLRQEARELVAEDLLDLVGLLDREGDPHGIHGALDEAPLLVRARDGDRVQQ